MIQRIQGDSRKTLRALPAGQVQCVVTSPPYWNLRSYLPAGHELKPLEIGTEKTTGAYIENLMLVFDGVSHVLRDDGCCWVNIADTYCSAWPCPRRNIIGEGALPDGTRANRPPRIPDERQEGDLAGIPFSFVQAMQMRGWIHRDTVIWSKACPMPTSVDGWRWSKCRVKINGRSEPNDPRGGFRQGDQTRERDGAAHRITDWKDCHGCDKCRANGGYILRKGSWRTTTAHEYLFLFTKQMGYYADAHAVRTPAKAATINRNEYSRVIDDDDEQYAVAHDHEFTGATANPRSVWEIGPEPLSGEKHYASYPTELARRCILASTSAKGRCPDCGMPWARVTTARVTTARVTTARVTTARVTTASDYTDESGRNDGTRPGSYESTGGESLGFRQCCGCKPAEPIPCLVLDPFGGSGRTANAAIELGRECILCELNPEFVEMQTRVNRTQLGMFG